MKRRLTPMARQLQAAIKASTRGNADALHRWLCNWNPEYLRLHDEHEGLEPAESNDARIEELETQMSQMRAHVAMTCDRRTKTKTGR